MVAILNEFPDYILVANPPCVISRFTRTIISTKNSSGEYPRVTIKNKEGVRKKIYMHRLMAIAFIPNPNNYPIVNHINNNKEDCSLENLEWCDYSYNTKHAISYIDYSKRNKRNIVSKDSQLYNKIKQYLY